MTDSTLGTAFVVKGSQNRHDPDVGKRGLKALLPVDDRMSTIG
jgi:hypothetical protein